NKTALGGKPTWAVWQEEDTNQQQNCRDDNHTQHPAPCTGVAEGSIRKISTEDPDSDHQLIHRDHTAANFFRRNFREVQWCGIRGQDRKSTRLNSSHVSI